MPQYHVRMKSGAVYRIEADSAAEAKRRVIKHQAQVQSIPGMTVTEKRLEQSVEKVSKE